ncbi:MAG: DUF6765 family protein [Thermodesulfobacteriota bacterium]|nr:DUF6765 family protein [Thermodesulfobacteriota bacterium]
MQIDMHFYGVYAMARAAGLDPKTARTVAHASQFVDDAIEDEHVLVANNSAIVPTMTSHKPLDYRNALPGEQWKVWIPFHFLPGNDPKGKTFVERMVTLPDSEPAKRMLAHTLDEKNRAYWPHLIGVTAHVYADTFSHFGFVGFASEWNRVKDDIRIRNVQKKSGMFKYIMGKFEEFKTRVLGTMAEVIPVGHGAVATLPDRPYLEWGFSYETHAGKPAYKSRNNTDYFSTACRRLQTYFNKFATKAGGGSNVKPNKAWNVIEKPVRSLLEKKEPLDQRIDAWRKAIAEGVFCKASEIDKRIRYEENRWYPKSSVRHERQVGQKIEDMDACAYIRAAWRHRNYVLPECDLVEF